MIEAPTALDAIIRTRRWQHALFTTYTLSLTFFESIVLRALQSQECADVWVVADADGYRSSLMERRSGRVGQEYRLVPVALPRGVFHAKCAYLGGPDGNLLLVGSGNLTFGGYGKNLEVLEILDARTEPACFADFADFLDVLQTRSDLIASDLTWARGFAELARAASRSFPATGAVRQARLMHSVSVPVLDQLAALCPDPAPHRELMILSPFHDADGRAVHRLANATGCTTITVGLSPRPGDGCPLDFAATRVWPQAVRAARPAGDGRSLHAKWIEISLGSEKLVLTGSINATSQALCTTNNVELGVVRRWANDDPLLELEEIEPPTEFVPRPVSRPGLGDDAVAHAAIRADGIVSGRVLSVADPSGTWSARLSSPRGEEFAFTVIVDSSGGFQARISQAERLAFASALQIELQSEESIARGWVQLDEILSMPRLSRIGVSALLRLINREETADDDLALLDYFALSSSKHLDTFARHVKLLPGADGGTDLAEEDVRVDLEDLSPDETQVHSPGHDTDAGMAEGAALERAFAQLRRRLITRSSTRAGQDDPLTNESAADEGDDPDAQDTQRRVTSSLEFFDNQMRLIVTTLKERARARAALVIWFEVGLHMRLGRLKDRAGAAAFVREWLDKACRETQISESPTALEQHVFSAAAMLATLAPEDSGRPRLLQQLHHLLERFVAGSVGVDRATAATRVGERLSFARLLVGEGCCLATGLLEILATKSRRQEILEVVADYDAGRPANPASTLVSISHQAEQLKALFACAGRRPVFKPQRGEAPVCAHCFLGLTPTAKLELERDGIVPCTSCRRWTYRGHP